MTGLTIKFMIRLIIYGPYMTVQQSYGGPWSAEHIFFIEINEFPYSPLLARFRL